MHKFSLEIKRLFISLIIGLVFVFSFSQFFTKPAEAGIGINRQINFQGKLVNNPSATNVANTSYTVVFTLYDNASGGTQLWQETQSVTTTDGIFRVALGSVTAFPANFNFNWSGLYLGIKVNADSEMTPRVQMAAVPFAFNAEKVAGLTVQDTSGNASTSGTLQIANAKTVSFADAFTTSGAFPLTLTTTASTSITLPTTGTLLTNTASANQTITSTQTTGNVLSLADSTGLTSAIVGLTIGLTSSTNSQNKTGISFDLSGGTGGVYYDLLGTGSTWSITRAGVLSVASCSGCGGSGVNWWNQLAGALSPVNTTDDFLLGSTATSSALFSYTGIKTGQTIASVSGQLIVMPNNGWGGQVGIGTTNPGAKLEVGGDILLSKNGNRTLSVATSDVLTYDFTIKSGLGGDGGSGHLYLLTPDAVTGMGHLLGNIYLAAGVQTSGSVAGNIILGSTGGLARGRVGIGTEDPRANLDVRSNNSYQGGTIPIASISGSTTFATLVANNDGVGDLFTASKSGLPIFTVKNNGQLVVGAPYYTATCTLKTDNTGLITCGTDNTGSGGGYSPFQELSGAIVPNNSTTDFLIGGQATASAQFGVLNIAKNQAVATVSGQFIVMAQNGWGGQLGIGTTTPGQALDVRGSGIFGNQLAYDVSAQPNRSKTIYANELTTNTTNDMFSTAGSLEVNPAGATSRIYYGGLYNVLSTSGNAQNFTGRLVGFQGQVSHKGTGTLTQARGFAGFITNDSTGTITDAFAGRFGNTNTSTGSYTNAYGVYILSPTNSGGGTFNTNYGLYVQDQSNVGVVGSYNIWSDGFNSKNYFVGSVGIGATPSARLHVAGSWGSNAAVIIDQLNSGDILAASASGTTKFVITNAGSIGLYGTNPSITNTGANTLTLNSGSTGDIQFFGTSYKITSGGALTVASCTGCGGGSGSSGPFAELTSLGLIVPNNSTEDFLIGGQASNSAKFAVLNVAGGTPTASIAGNLVLGSSAGTVRTIGATAKNALQLGDTNTGAVQINPNGSTGLYVNGSGNVGIGTTNPGAKLNIAGAGATAHPAMLYLSNAAAPTYYWDIWRDNLVGDLNIASVVNSVSRTYLTINGDTGSVGIGAISPLSTFDVRPNTTDGGTISVASISGKTSFAAFVVDNAGNAGVGDLFTASASGATRFVIAQNGTVTIGNSTDGLVFSPTGGGPTYSGTGRPTKTITLSPEYAGAVLTASDSASTHTGSMTSDASSSAALSNFRTYYEWSSTQTSLQDYTVVVRVTLPKDFDDFDSTANSAMHINFNTASTVATTNKLDIFIYNGDVALAKPGNPVVYRQANVSATNKVWKTVDIDRADLIDNAEGFASPAAGDVMIIYLKMYASGTYNYTQVGDIQIDYKAKF